MVNSRPKNGRLEDWALISPRAFPRHSASVPLSARPQLPIALRSGMARRVRRDGRAGQGPDAGGCPHLAAARGGAGPRLRSTGVLRMVVLRREASRLAP